MPSSLRACPDHAHMRGNMLVLARPSRYASTYTNPRRSIRTHTLMHRHGSSNSVHESNQRNTSAGSTDHGQTHAEGSTVPCLLGVYRHHYSTGRCAHMSKAACVRIDYACGRNKRSPTGKTPLKQGWGYLCTPLIGCH